MDNTKRSHIKIGMWVDIVLKKDQPTGILTRGQVGKILTNKAVHPRGIKVMLKDGQVGRVQKILSQDEIREETRRFYENFFSLPAVYGLFNLTTQSFVIFRYTNPKTQAVEKTALLFEKKKDLEEFIYGTHYYKGDYVAMSIPKNESILNHFLPFFVDYFRINGERKISAENLLKLEQRYRSFNEDDLI